MPDLSVRVIVINKTNQRLRKNSTHASYGHWVSVPDGIQPNSKSVQFRIVDEFGSYGSDGTFDFLEELSGSHLSTYQACPWGTDSNAVSAKKPEPEAIFDVNFRASVDDGPWTYNWVEGEGHPVSVEYTFSYQKKRYRFEVVRIFASSDHPVRNSRNNLIAASHKLWDRSNADKWADGNEGSFEPNIFKYDFSSQVASSSTLTVTIRALDIQLVGAECFIYGEVNGTRVCKSDYFFINSLNEISETVNIISPRTSSKPFAWNADVEWGMELRLNHLSVECIQPSATRLELYWIADTIHRAFQRGVPVGFLRSTLGSMHATNVLSFDPVKNSEFNKDMTRHVFEDYNKIYDTIAGRAACGVGVWGGPFDEEYFRASNESGAQGTLARYVNCMDQAAMLELSCSLRGGIRDTSWLVQQPFGYINDTHLVGVVNQSGQLILVNNPFFGTDKGRSRVDINDHGRTAFGCHVYNGHSKPFTLDNNGIYDACGGPHLGNEGPADYLSQTIDTQTGLYNITGTTYGTTENIQMGDGITRINGQYWEPPATLQRLPEKTRTNVSNLLTLLAAGTANQSVSHVNWAHVPDWINNVLGNHWKVKYGRVTAGNATANAFWHLENGIGVEGASPLRVDVHVESMLDASGALDMALSEDAVRNRLTSIVTSTDRDIEKLWVVGGSLNGFGSSLQYSNDVPAGRFIIFAANMLIDISGMSSNDALQGYAQKLLEHTVNRHRTPLTVPVILRGPIRTRGNFAVTSSVESNTNDITVEGVNNRFSIHFELANSIAAADATPEGTGVLFDNYVVEEGSDANAIAVDFMFLTREMGSHVVKVHFADSLTMVSVSQMVKVNVV